MHFDASPKTLKGLHTLLRKDPRVIRWTMLKEGEKLEDVVELKEQTIEHSSIFDSASSAPTSSPVSSRSHGNPLSSVFPTADFVAFNLRIENVSAF